MGCRLPDFWAPCRAIAFQPRRWWRRLAFRRRPSCQDLGIDRRAVQLPVLDRAHLRQKYFNDEGRTGHPLPFLFYAQADGIHIYIYPDKLLRITDLCPLSIEQALANYKILSKEEIAPAASFIKACFRLNSFYKPSDPFELELHPWLKGAFCGWGIYGIFINSLPSMVSFLQANLLEISYLSSKMPCRHWIIAC